MKKSEQKAFNAELCDIIVRPVITEKAMKSAENNQVTFVVRGDATEPLRADARFKRINSPPRYYAFGYESPHRETKPTQALVI